MPGGTQGEAGRVDEVGAIIRSATAQQSPDSTVLRTSVSRPTHRLNDASASSFQPTARNPLNFRNTPTSPNEQAPEPVEPVRPTRQSRRIFPQELCPNVRPAVAFVCGALECRIRLKRLCYECPQRVGTCRRLSQDFDRTRELRAFALRRPSRGLACCCDLCLCLDLHEILVADQRGPDQRVGRHDARRSARRARAPRPPSR